MIDRASGKMAKLSCEGSTIDLLIQEVSVRQLQPEFASIRGDGDPFPRVHVVRHHEYPDRIEIHALIIPAVRIQLPVLRDDRFTLAALLPKQPEPEDEDHIDDHDWED